MEGVDRAVRIVLGIILIGLGLLRVVTGTATVIAYIVGAIALVTALVRFCPAWSVLGGNTCSTRYRMKR